MKTAKILSVAICALAPFFFVSPAKADNIDFTFTGTGINGSTVSGEFTVDETALAPGYSALGGIFPSLSLTISNIPGGGPASVSFSLSDLPFTRFLVDAGGVAYIAPYGGHDFGAPGFNHYDLGQPSQPFVGLPTFQTELSYNGGARDLITWSPAVRVAAVPEAGSTAAYLAMALVMFAAGARRRMRAA